MDNEIAVIKTTEGEMALETLARSRPEDRRELQGAGPKGIAPWHLFSPSNQGFHDPGR